MSCPYCGRYHAETCPRVKRMEYFANGQLRRVEFHDPNSRPPGTQPLDVLAEIGFAKPSLPMMLSPSEVRVLREIGLGHSNKVIGRKFSISEATVKVHVKSIMRKLRTRNRTQAAVWFQREGKALIDPPIALPAEINDGPGPMLLPP